MEPHHTENRRSRRYRGDVDVDVTDKKGTRRGRAVDIARHGLFVALRDLPANRHLVQLRIQLPDGEVQAAATVTRHQPGQGVGLALFALSDEAKARWDAYTQRTHEMHLATAHREEAQRQLVSSLSSSTPSTTTRSAETTATTSAVGGALAQPPSTGAATTVPGSASTFFLRLRTLTRLREYQLLHVQAGGTILFTPALLPAGAAVSIVVVHPTTNAGFPLSGVVQRAVTTRPKRLEILFRATDVAAFERFIDTGLQPSTSTTDTRGPGQDELELTLDDVLAAADDDGPHPDPGIRSGASVALDEDFELSIDVGDQDDGSAKGTALSEAALSTAALSTAALSSGAEGSGPTADDDSATIALPDLFLDDVVAVTGPGLHARAYAVTCDRCDDPGERVMLGPCSGTLGLVADLVPFLDPKSKRIVSAPRLAPAAVRLERWQTYVAGGGSGHDLTTLAILFDAASLAEPPVHPLTGDPLRWTRALERMGATAARMKPGEVVTTKASCPCCTKGHLQLHFRSDHDDQDDGDAGIHEEKTAGASEQDLIDGESASPADRS